MMLKFISERGVEHFINTNTINFVMKEDNKVRVSLSSDSLIVGDLDQNQDFYKQVSGQ